ncbi:MAG: molecular chaperone HtpG [Clostridia bacterium]|nr:molecular chaperone HtpG [Clostridia bacterium]
MKKFKTESQKVLDMMINSIYTNKEIFLRELLSNCSDAIDKLYFKSLTDGISGLSRNDFHIDIKLDKDNRTITISDNGIGMTASELEENLGTIAHSGSLEFKNNDKLKEEDINIIGQFGVGFYSAFMVAKKVEVISKAYGEETANIWTSSGVNGYDIKPCEKESNGTDIILYIKENTENDTFDSYLEEYKIKNLVKKYSDYIRYPIQMEVTKFKPNADEEGKQEKYLEKDTLNAIVPIWKKNKSEVTKEEYDEFYKENFFDGTNPLKTIHMSVEGAVDFKALLFIPETVPYNYYSKQYEKGLKLYTNGVMIMEKCADLLPDYFSFVRGLVDSEVTLNVSREVVQQTRQLTQIGASIEKKIKSELENLLKNDRENYEKFFKAFGLQIKFGIYQSFGAKAEVLKDLVLFHSLKEDKLVTLKEYVENMGVNKDSIFYASGKTVSAVKSLPKVEKLLNDGIDVLAMVDEVDEFAIKFMGEYDKKPFKNATQEVSVESGDVKEEDKPILDAIKDALDGKVEKVVTTKALVNHAVCLSSEGEISIEMEKVMSAMPNAENAMKVTKVLEINENHAIYNKLKTLFNEDKEKFNDLAKVLYVQSALVAGLEVDNIGEMSDLIINLLV